MGDRERREAFETLFGVPVPSLTAAHDDTGRYDAEIDDGLGRTLSVEAIVLDITGYQEER